MQYKSTPTISIITATLNCADTITECLNSVATQTYLDREHLIIDGGSVDETLKIINEHRERLAVVITGPDQGIYDALNKGIIRSTGDVIGFLHSDDIYASPNVLDHIAQVFIDPRVCAVYGDLEYVQRVNTDKTIRLWRSSSFNRNKLRWGWMPPHPTLYVRRDWYNKIGGFNLRYTIASDYFSILNLFSHDDFNSVYIPEVLVKMRVGGVSNRSIKNIIHKTLEDLDALKSSGIGGVGSLFLKNFSKINQFF